MSNGRSLFPSLIVIKKTNIIVYVDLYVSHFMERFNVHNVDINLILCLIYGFKNRTRLADLTDQTVNRWTFRLMNRFVIKPTLNHLNWQLNRQTGQTIRFFANRSHFNLTNICLLFKRPIIHQIHFTPNTYKTKTNYKPIFCPSH